MLVLEILGFGLIGKNFLTLGNAAEVMRLCAELGLLAVALTPVIVSGGIDLSVGSLMGLCAVLLGKM
jgi:rhamnose transport system permease protein